MAQSETDKKHSLEWSLSYELGKRCRRKTITIVTLSVLWITTIVGFLLYISTIQRG
jgi:hypothetical protein